MEKEVISNKQAICLITLFITGSTLLFGIGAEAEKDTWIAIILSILFVMPIVMIYARILSLFAGKDLFDILQFIFGKFLGKSISFLYIWLGLHLGALVLRDFGEFPTIVSIPNTPKIIPMILTIFLCAWAIKEGIEVLGRCGEIFLWIVGFLTVLGVFLVMPKMNIQNIQPALFKGVKPIIKGAFAVFSFPFAETVLFCTVFSTLRNKKSPYKVYSLGIIIGGVMVFIVLLTTFLVLGFDSYASNFFPTYSVAARINVGDFIQRAEIIVAIGFFLGGFIKISICLLSVCKGIAKVFGYNDYRFMVTAIGLLMLNLSYLLHDNFIQVGEWTIKNWRYYAFPFQVILPIIIWICAEIKNRKINIKLERG